MESRSVLQLNGYSVLIVLGGVLYLLEPFVFFFLLYRMPVNYIMGYYGRFFNYVVVLPLFLVISGTFTFVDRPFMRKFGSMLAIILAYVNLFLAPVGIGFIPAIIGAVQKF
jgi:hypothetical protein